MVLIDLKQDVRNSKKKFYQDVRYKDFPIITPRFIKFLERTGERSCDCKNAKPIQIIQTLTDGTQIPKIQCSSCGGSYYKIPDFSFVMLILGRKGGGKTTTVFTFTDIIHQIDVHRKIKLWQCPPNLISELHNLHLCKYYDVTCELALGFDEWKRYYPIFINPDTPKEDNFDEKGKLHPPEFQIKEMKYRVCKFCTTDYAEYKNKVDDREVKKQIVNDCQKCSHFQLGKPYFERIERLDEVEFDDIVVIDEGIISVNAKEALSKKMRDFDKFLAVVRHKRICLFVLFQRFEVIKALREMSDMLLYKSLPRKLIENEKFDKFIINNGDRIRRLKRSEGLILSDHQDFDDCGLLNNNVPYWYTKDVSMSYASEFSFVDHTVEERHALERAEEMAQHLFEMDLPIFSKPNEQKAMKFILRKEYADIQPPISNKEINMAIEAYFKFCFVDGYGQEEVVENTIADDDLSLVKNLNINKVHYTVFKEVCLKDRSFTDFDKDPYNLSKQDVSRIVRDVGKYLIARLERQSASENSDREGMDTERRVVRESWDNEGYAVRAVGSGGERNKIPHPDCLEITKDGLIRPVQIKERKKESNIVTFSPLTFNAEFRLMNRIRNVAHRSTFKCPHCLEPIRDVLKPDSVYLYLATNDQNDPIIKEKLEYRDNKKTIKVDMTTKKVIREEPDMAKIKSPKLKKFLEGKDNLYNGEEDLVETPEENTEPDPSNPKNPTPEKPKEKDKELDDLVNIDKLIAEVSKFDKTVTKGIQTNTKS